MRVLVACEFSGIVRDAFAARGHDAWSCDYLPTERPGNHLQCSVLSQRVVNMGWDLLIAHPDCTFLTVSANAYFDEWRVEARLAAMHFVRALWAFPVPHIAIENPIGVLSTFWRRPEQSIQPWQFGHPEAKQTCLWLKNLPPLQPTNVLTPRNGNPKRGWDNQTPSGQNKLGPSPTRSLDRARTYQGIADAMAEQWGALERIAA